MIGRPKEFDRQEALRKAMELFWTRGYEATGMRDLLEGMGIGRQSLYDTFGDKHSLFLEAVEQYNQCATQKLVDSLSAAGSPLGNVRRTLMAMAEMCGDKPCRGCLLTNTLVELAPHDPEVAAAAKRVLSRVESAFRKTLERAVEQGELPKDAKVRALARFLCNTLQGLTVMGKAGASRGAVKDIVEVALSAVEK